MSTRIITPATALPVTLAQARLACNIDATGDSAYEAALDDILTMEILAAMALCVHNTGRSVMPQVCELSLDAFPDTRDIELSYPDVLTVDSFTYVRASDSATVAITSGQYSIESGSQYESWLLAAEGFEWPATAEVANAVKVRYTAGYANANAVPPKIKKWILSVVKFNRDGGGGGELPRDFNAGYLDEFLVPKV